MDAVSRQYMIQVIDDRHSSAAERYQRICEKRDAQIRQSRYVALEHWLMQYYVFYRRESRVLRSLEHKLAAACLEASFEKWRGEIDLHSKHSSERAQKVVQVSYSMYLLFLSKSCSFTPAENTCTSPN